MDIQSWIRDHHASYEVSPYFLMLEDRGAGTSQKVQAGFTVDVYGVNPEGDRLAPPPPHEYAFGYGAVARLVAEVGRELGDACSLEVIAYPGKVVIDPRGYGTVKATLQITISHVGPLVQPAGPAEHQALEKVKARLDALGIVRR